MSKKPAASSSGASKEFEPAGTKSITFDKFKADLTTNDIKHLFGTGTVVFPFGAIDTLSPVRTVGKGRTNITLIESTIVQVDTTPPTPPFASFDKSLSQRNPTAQIHFDPAGYGNTSPWTYIVEFLISVVGTSTFRVSTGPVIASGTGTRTLSGDNRVSVVFSALPSNQQVFAFIEQTSGGSWTWFQTSISFPPLVIEL